MCVGRHGFNEQVFGANEQVSRTATTPLEKRSAQCLAEREGPNCTFDPLCLTCPGQHVSPCGRGLFLSSDEQIFGADEQAPKVAAGVVQKMHSVSN